MQFLSLFVIAELIIGLTIAQAPEWHNLKNSSRRAAILLADDTAPPADAPADSGADNGETNPQSEPGQDTGQEQSIPGSDNVGPEQPNGQEQANPEENQTNENIQPESAPEEQNVNNPTEEFSPTESALLTDVGNYTNLDNIDQTYIDKAQVEDSQLEQTDSPAEAVPLLIDFASNKVDDIGTLIENNDFTSANFTLQRLNDQVDQALAEIGSLGGRENAPLKQELIKFSEQADSVFRWQQLIVPEKLEQDFEISRGQFLNIEQTK